MGEAMAFAPACRVDDRQCTGRLMSLTQIKARRAHRGEHSLSSDRQWFRWRRAAAAELPGFKHWKGNAGVDDMRLDSGTKRDVEDELSRDPDLDAIDIGVTV
jgi:hypothetical protein